MHAYFAGKTGDRQLAADLMQEVFLRAWQHLDKVADRPDDGRRGWLFTVARNLSVDTARHQCTADGTRPRPSATTMMHAGFAARMVASTAPVRVAA